MGSKLLIAFRRYKIISQYINLAFGSSRERHILLKRWILDLECHEIRVKNLFDNSRTHVTPTSFPAAMGYQIGSRILDHT